MSGFGAPARTAMPMPRQHEVDARAGLDLARGDQRVERLRRDDDDVGGLAAREPRRDRVGCAARRCAEDADEVVARATARTTAPRRGTAP